MANVTLLFYLLLHLCMYPKTMTVVKVDCARDTVTCEDCNGNLWQFEGVEDWQRGDIVSAIMYGNETEIIYDDEIVSVRYGGKGE